MKIYGKQDYVQVTYWADDTIAIRVGDESDDDYQWALLSHGAADVLIKSIQDAKEGLADAEDDEFAEALDPFDAIDQEGQGG